jgi:hypothetical protein
MAKDPLLIALFDDVAGSNSATASTTMQDARLTGKALIAHSFRLQTRRIESIPRAARADSTRARFGWPLLTD